MSLLLKSIGCTCSQGAMSFLPLYLWPLASCCMKDTPRVCSSFLSLFPSFPIPATRHAPLSMNMPEESDEASCCHDDFLGLSQSTMKTALPYYMSQLTSQSKEGTQALELETSRFRVQLHHFLLMILGKLFILSVPWR